jgi:UDP-N-acetylglucosamine acyltransferase
VIHPTVVIAPSAKVGAGVTAGPFVVIEDDVVIGDGCQIGAHAVIKRHTRLGARNRIYEHAVIGGDPQDFKFAADSDSFTEIGDDNVFREGVTVHRGSRPGEATHIGNQCFLMAYVHVAHDCQLGNNIVIANGTNLAGEVVVEDRANISGNVSVHQFCRIGTFAMVSQSSKINQNALPYCVTEGNPSTARALNLVGLRRNGFSREDIAALKEAYRLLYRHVPLAKALATMEAMQHPAVNHLAEFIRRSTAPKARGFAHPGA